MSDYWIQTYTGVRFDLLEPTPDMVRLDDIAWSLAHIRRFGGHAGAYTVAEHSLLVAKVCPVELQLEALLHDAHEAYVGDIVSPVQGAILAHHVRRQDASPCGLEEVAYNVRECVRDAFGISPATPTPVWRADRRMLITERDQLMGPAPEPWMGDVEPTPYQHPDRPAHGSMDPVVDVREYSDLTAKSLAELYIDCVKRTMEARRVVAQARAEGAPLDNPDDVEAQS